MLVRGALQTFAIVFALHWVWTLVVGNSAVTASVDDPSLRATMIPGWMFYGVVPRIHPENWVFASALWMIAANVLLVSLALRWFYRDQPPQADDGLIRFLAGLAVTTLTVLYLRKRGRLLEIKPDHLYNLGGFLFASIVFWSYIGFAQYLLMWYANIP